MNQYSKLILFDVDDTLVKAAGHIEAFAIGMKEVYGVNATVHMINPHGMTDQQIIYDVLIKKGLSPAVIEQGMTRCMQSMANYYSDVLPNIISIQIKPGVPELLEHLKKEGYLLGLITGNIEPMAHGKMQKIGIDEYFKVGGFGSDARIRSELVDKAIERAVAQFGFVRDNNVFVVGDTPLDLQAALAAKTLPICVATGSYSKEELLKAGAPIVLDDLRDIDYFLKLTTQAMLN